MYFAILGRHPKLSLAEFSCIPTTVLRRQWQSIVFETTLDEELLWSQLAKLWGIVKWGKIIEVEKPKHAEKAEDSEDEQSGVIASFLQWVEIIGVNDQKLGMELKRIYGVKRFKILDITGSDLEIKKEWKELISMQGWCIGLVYGRQDIQHFEVIDFGKPLSGMEVGMMPAKLTQILVNIGIAERAKQAEKAKNDNCYTIYDPFCGFGTTGFVANRLGHHFVGSDMNITACKENGKWRAELKNVTEEWKIAVDSKTFFTAFKHDVTEAFDHPVVDKVDVIVTEGWLWPVVSKKTKDHELKLHIEKIVSLYTAFLKHIVDRRPWLPIVITVPNHTRMPWLVLEKVMQQAILLGYNTQHIDSYSRKWQEVTREVVVLTGEK